ncbi:hypothetical protein D9Q98_009913 [Chlorella vulgaris]|uniref:Proteasome activator subunit 4 n=1 Tax=Chlorella vulgaris TaxID=3077 RepID=A0A9D4YSX5_CHLVU|nr:hypothetical protein D9Q98_009913 [Chlorella vulgaris]
MVGSCVWNDWLPEAQAEEIRTEEPLRYAALVRHLCQQWQRDRAELGLAAAAEATLPFVPLAKCLMNARAEPEPAVLNQFVEFMLDVVLSCQSDLVVQVRWAQQLHRLLRVHRRKLQVSVPWRPLYEMMRRQGMEPSAAYEGGGVAEARHQALVTLVHRCRRYFPPGSAAEMWDHFAPALADPQRPECFEALGWLAMLLPTHEAMRTEGGWREWAPRWLHLWQQLDHCRYWDSLWFALFSRLAKHDVHGMVDWPVLLPQLYTRFMWAFEVPVGAATGSPPFSYPAPGLCQLLFNAELKSRSSCIAKATIYLLGRGGGGSPQQDPVWPHLEGVANLLEQYYHPSNSGRWSATLSNFMRELTTHLCKRLVAEHYAAIGAANGSDSDGEDLADAGLDDPAAGSAEEEAAGGGGLSGLLPMLRAQSAQHTDDTSSTDEELAASPAAHAPPSARQHLAAPTRRAVAALLLRLAGKAQFAKDKGSARIASQVLAALAHLAPDIVLPHVHAHFATALETITSASQLGTAIQTLSLCVRPLMIAGLTPLAPPQESGGGSGGGGAVLGAAVAAAPEPPPPASEEQRATAAQALASALMATLPGIDANDEPKSLAAFRFYCCVLGALGQLPEGPTAALPLLSEEWVDELLARCFAIISNLDSPEHRGEHGGHQGQKGMEDGSFLLDSNSMFRPLMELLFARLPPSLRKGAIRRVAKFLLESTFTSVAAEASVLCNAVAWADSQCTAQLLLGPLVEAMERELAGAVADGTTRLSKAHEGSLTWRLGLLSSTAFRSGPALTPFQPRILRIVAVLAAAPSQSVQEATARAVGSMLSGLLSFYPTNQHDPCIDVYSLGDGLSIECCVDKFGTGCSQPLTWHEPSAEEVAFGEALVRTALLEPAQRLRQLSSAGGEVPKETLKALLLQMEGVLGGARTCLPDLPLPAAAASAAAGGQRRQPLALLGRSGVQLSGGGEGGGPRAVAAEALLVAAGCIGATSDSDSLRQLVLAMDGVLAVGTSEYADSTSNLAAWNSDEKWMHEPAVAGLLRAEQHVAATTVGGGEGGGGGNGGGKGSIKWRRRRPRWLVAEKVFLNLEWRASQAAYRPWASLELPCPPLEQLPPLVVQLVQQGVRFATHSYPDVREAGVSLLERVVKRYPCLAPLVLPPLLAALAKLPADEAVPWGGSTSDLLPALQQAVARAGAAAAAAAADGQPEPEAEQALAVGACRVLEGRAVWRHVSRDPAASRGLLLGLLASAAHTGAEAQSSILRCFLITAFRFTAPNHGDGAESAAMIDDVLAAAEQPGLHWRYRCLAECALCMLLPLLDAATATAVTRHWAALLTSDMLLLRQLAAAGLTMLLLPVWHVPHPGALGGGRSLAAAADEQMAAADEQELPPQQRRIDAAAVQAAAAALRGVVLADPAAFAAGLFQQLAHGHPLLGAEGQQQRSARQMLGGSRDDMMMKMVTGTLSRAAIWPHGRETIPLLSKDGFIATHAQLVQVLAVVVPESVAAFRQPLEAALGQSQDQDRPATAAAAEVLAGLLAVPAIYSSGGAWGEWVGPALTQAMAAAPLENVELWSSCALRYAAHHLAIAELAAAAPAELAPGLEAPALAAQLSPLQLLVDAVAEPLPEGATSSQAYKRISSLLLLTAEVATATGSARPPPLLRRLQARLLLELPSLAQLPGENVRLAAAQLSAFVPCCVLEAEESSSAAATSAPAGIGHGDGNGNGNGNGGSDAEMVVVGPGSARASSAASLEAVAAGTGSEDPVLLVQCSAAALRRAAVAYLDGVVAEFDASVQCLYAAHRSEEKGSLPDSAAARDSAAATARGGAEGEVVMAEAAAGVDGEQPELETQQEGGEGEEEGVAGVSMSEDEAVLVVGGAAAAAGSGETAVQGSTEYQAAVAQVSFTVQLMVQALTGGEGPGLAPWLARMLGSLLRVQEVIPSELQFVALEARKALVCFKYLPLPASLVGPVLSTLEQASAAELWPERASALLFAQYFWFRHTFLLGPQGTARVQAMVVAMLSDPKLEVREMAATTLSGLLKGLPPKDADALRQNFTDQALQLFPLNKRRRTAGGGTAAPPAGGAASLAQRHAVVLGLKAFVLSTPYDVPGWLPDVLMALVRLAPEPPPLRTSVTKTLSEFRRTHEEAGLSEVRELLSAEQWEAIRDVASPASYFV